MDRLTGFERIPRYRVQARSAAGKARGGVADDLVGQEVGAGALRRVVSGIGYEELSGRVEGLRIPSCGEHSLAEDEVCVFALADPEADADVHLRADCSLAHGFLGWPLCRGDEGNRDRAP